ncbi:MAG: hypothetical protein RMJ04_13435 [Geminicoccaceae bacterium]|nr:hypothetical protein [Geminicoccaceae bacterium]
MFPFRRGGKKRGKGGGGAGGRRFEAARRGGLPVHELLNQLQPATKALAQVLAGNVKSSGQLQHARNLLAQAERALEERAIDRLSPAQREEFLEHLARLKLTVADAEAAAAQAAEAQAAEAAKPRPAVDPGRLRELALSLARETSRAPAPPPPEPAVELAPRLVEAEEPAPPPPPPPPAAVPPGSPRAARLRLKTTLLPRER